MVSEVVKGGGVGVELLLQVSVDVVKGTEVLEDDKVGGSVVEVLLHEVGGVGVGKEELELVERSSVVVVSTLLVDPENE